MITNSLLDNSSKAQYYNINTKTKDIELLQSANKFGMQVQISLYGVQNSNFMKLTPYYKTSRNKKRRKKYVCVRKVDKQFEDFKKLRKMTKRMDIFKLRKQITMIMDKRREVIQRKYGNVGNLVRNNKRNIKKKMIMKT
jgi:hypothetical protein